jgi:hypothetical protein
MRLYFGGGEIPSHTRVLDDVGVKNVAMSYMGLRRRVKFAKPWLVKDHFPTYMSVFLDSGSYTLNTKPDITSDEIEEINEHYQDFVRANLDHVDLVAEFDAMAMGLEWIEEQRDVFWKHVPREKFMAVWHPVWGLSYLHEMASRFEVIGILETSMEGRDLRPTLNALAAKGTRLHGVAMTHMKEMQSINWDSVASTSWISPNRFGDTIVWTGNELKRYPKKSKDQARKRHRTLFTREGFNAAAIAADDPTEVLKLSAWSWLQFEGYVNRRNKSGSTVTHLFSDAAPPEVETGDDGVDDLPEETSNEVSTPSPTKAVAVRREANQILPVMGLGKTDEEDEDSDPVVNIRSDSARICNTCFLSEKCPGYEEDSNCVYNIPITIKSRDQVRALRQGMVEMQTQRVMFMRMAEEVEGGYADPNLTKEMVLLDKMISSLEESERDGFSLSITARGSQQQASAGVISRLFGDRAGQQVQAIESTRADDIIEAEYTE